MKHRTDEASIRRILQTVSLPSGGPGLEHAGIRYTSSMNDDATYICDACGEEIVVPIDLTQGTSQDYVEDCPVCCRPNLIHVEVDEDGDIRVWAEAE
ncbi:MAG: CPXCG motif-containing cysteine-rich protein [Planctomycetota bacterium]|nr:CPXCG motif-containing cysteine-rich protein [Planctomycetota bacterium]